MASMQRNSLTYAAHQFQPEAKNSEIRVAAMLSTSPTVKTAVKNISSRAKLSSAGLLGSGSICASAMHGITLQKIWVCPVMIQSPRKWAKSQMNSANDQATSLVDRAF